MRENREEPATNRVGGFVVVAVLPGLLTKEDTRSDGNVTAFVPKLVVKVGGGACR